MTDATRTRYCGNCGKEVGATDVICPHCDALLAAYEAPSGASDGTSAAVMPVDTSTPSTTPPTQPAYAEPTRIEVPPPTSPTATAIEETKAAAAEPGNAGEPDDDAWPISSQPVSDTLTDTIEVNEAPATHPGPISQTLADTRKKVDTHSAPSVVELATPQPQPQPKPEPRPTPPVVTSSPPAAHPTPGRLDQETTTPQDAEQAQSRKKMPAKGSSSVGQTIVFILIAVFIFSRISGGAAFFGSIVTFVAIGVVIWFIVRITNATGRKTTSMPWDDQFRKRRR